MALTFPPNEMAALRAERDTLARAILTMGAARAAVGDAGLMRLVEEHAPNALAHALSTFDVCLDEAVKLARGALSPTPEARPTPSLAPPPALGEPVDAESVEALVAVFKQWDGAGLGAPSLRKIVRHLLRAPATSSSAGPALGEGDHEAATLRHVAIEQEIHDYLWDHDLPIGHAFKAEWRETTLRFLAEFVDERDQRQRAAATEVVSTDATPTPADERATPREES